MKNTLSTFFIILIAVCFIGCGAGADKMSYNAGTYTAAAQGMNGDVEVTVTFSNSTIKKIDIGKHGETPGISDAPIKQIPEQIIKTQSLAVDAVTGATRTSNAILKAVELAAEQAGGNVNALKNKKPAAKSGKAVKKTTDIVVVGGGGAGLSAAIEAAGAGSKVILVEKMAILGGNTLLSYAELACPNNWLQTEKGIQDSPEQFAKEMYEGGGKLAKKELVDIIAYNATDAALWLRDTIGVKYQDYLVHEGGHSVPRAVEPIELGPGMIRPLKEYAEKLGVEILLNTKAEELIKDKTGKITGVKAMQKDGTPVILETKKAVILAAGGFGANVEMRQKYNTRWETLDASVKTTNSPAIVGEGIIMAEKAGANLIGMEHIQLYPFNNPITGVFYGIEAPSWSGEGLIYVNKDGKRFVNEVGMRDARAEGILAQGGVAYAIYNQEVADRLHLEEKFKDEYAKTLADGVFFKANTLEEVAKRFDINAENLVKTMDAYNKGISTNTDEFGRTTSMVTMKTGPWFILKGVVSVHHTMGGIEINEKAQVLDVNGNIIPGLYAAGEITGGIHGNNRVGTCAISDIVVFGRIAGSNASKE
ncbi:flavocytochrome c [Treponema sp. OMZ 840]|uniref:flavocytochrome c n=1 Tax=Treponema sp. OMZ 840 TaxID=244313 RepID=UPI003D8E6FF4